MVSLSFALIGAMKSGTTFLYQVLAKHPHLCASAIKEPDFFLRDARKDGDEVGSEAWYASLFLQPTKLCFEASTAYTKYSYDWRIAGRMAAHNAGMKLIYLVRDPVERAVSHYLHNVLSGREQRDICDALLHPASHYARTSRYYEQLDPFRARFSANQILIMSSTLLRTTPAVAVSNVCSFLQVPNHFCYSPTEYDHSLLARMRIRLRSGCSWKEGAPKQLRSLIEHAPDVERLTSDALASALGFSAEHREKLRIKLEQDAQLLAEYRKTSWCNQGMVTE